MLQLKEYYSAKELSQFALNSLPSSDRRILDRAIKGAWLSRKREGRGGGLEFALSSMPVDVQKELRTKLLQLAPPELAKGELSLRRQEIALDRVSDKQLSVADNRI
ncbi:transposase, partial [Pasteurellaceae bacterium 15-036681]